MFSDLPTIFDSATIYLVACGVLVLATAVYISLGFGGGMIAVGALALVFADVRDVVVVLLLIAVPMELGVVLLLRRDIKWRQATVGAIAMGIGTPVGALVLANGAPDFLLGLLGGFLALFGVLFLFLPSGLGRSLGDLSLAAAGMVAGLLGGLFGVGGPPMALYCQLRGIDKAAFRGTLIAIFFLSNLVRLPSYASQGLVTEERLWSALAIIPPLLIGGWIGHRIHLGLSEVAFRRGVSVVVAVIGGLLLLRP